MKINFKILNIFGVAMVLSLLVPITNANEYGISEQKLSEIEARVNQMSIDQLNARRSALLVEQASLNESMEDSNSGNSSGGSMGNRLKEITAELSSIQKALIAIAGLGAVSALTKAMEPLIVLVVAGIVGTIVISLYLPMFDLIKAFKS